jgi:hypothetical protein
VISTSSREFLEAARLRGAAWAARTLFRRFFFSHRRAYLLWIPLTVSDQPTADLGFAHRLATRNDLDRLTVFEPYVPRSRMRRWLESESTWVFLALDGDRPVAFDCNSSAAPRDTILPPIVLAKHQAWTNELYVVPEYRRRHVSVGLRQYRNREMMGLGFTETVSKVDEDNYASLRRIYFILPPGARVQRIGCLCVLGARFHRVEEDGMRLLEDHLARASTRGSA